jgi:hypothetical protein
MWCGWACPQTVFLDHVYRKIERWIDGDALARRALDAAPWTTRKIGQRLAKHAAYLVVSAAIAHLFLAYFVSIPELWYMMRAAPVAHWSAFAFVGVSTAVLYFNFAWFREQLCIVICPYGRLQSVLIDDNSLVIGYDARRGEPRGKLHRETCEVGGAQIRFLSERLPGDMGGTPMPRLPRPWRVARASRPWVWAPRAKSDFAPWGGGAEPCRVRNGGIRRCRPTKTQAIASPAIAACRCAPPASISGRGCRSSASGARPASTRATR